MSENRNEQRSTPPPPDLAVLVAEALRNSTQAGTVQPPTKGEERISLFWRVLGGTVLSIIALVAVTIYNQFTNNFNEMRGELSRVHETHGELIKKEEFNVRMKSVWESLKEQRADNTGVAVLKEKCAVLEQQVKAGEEERKELSRELQRLREAKAGADERRELIHELQRLHERLAVVEGRPAATSSVQSTIPIND